MYEIILTILLVIFFIIMIILFNESFNESKIKNNKLYQIPLTYKEKETIAKWVYNRRCDIDGYMGPGYIELDILKIVHDKYGEKMFGKKDREYIKIYNNLFGGK